MTNHPKKAIVIGAGPAGLTAAKELLDRTDVCVVVLEASQDVGGIAKSVYFKGNILDLGGHRYFSNSTRVNRWWEEVLPDMLTRRRASRILFNKKLINYPLTFQWDTFSKLGFSALVKMAIGYFKAKLFPRREKTLEDFFVNRFGEELYGFFFKSYTRKLWGIPASQLSPEWGKQRIQKVSISRLILKALRLYGSNSQASLIDYFKYPKLGAGQMWQEAAAIIRQKKGEIYLRHKVTGINSDGKRIVSVEAQDLDSGKTITMEADYFFSTMPIRELIRAFKQDAPDAVREVAQGLKYRSLITVGVLLKKLNCILADNWIYVQEKDFKLGRIQVFNNWSTYLVRDENTVWLGLEYFCSEDDSFWNKSDEEIAGFALEELFKTGFMDREDILDSVVVRAPKAYPVYCGGYFSLSTIREFTDSFENLFLIGRNGLHRYNNIDHSMLTAMAAVDNIIEGIKSKDNIWAVNSA